MWKSFPVKLGTVINKDSTNKISSILSKINVPTKQKYNEIFFLLNNLMNICTRVFMTVFPIAKKILFLAKKYTFVSLAIEKLIQIFL